jgi:FO synthase
LREVTEGRGMVLAPRLTVYPEYIANISLDPARQFDPDHNRWIDPTLRFAVLDRCDAESMGRDDPGAVWPEKVTAADVVHDGAEVVLVGHRSTPWYSGSENKPPVIVSPSDGSRGSTTTGRTRVHEIIDGHASGLELGVDEIVALFRARGPEVRAIADYADELRHEVCGDRVTWVHNRNINYTNVCTFKCKFCGFSKGPLSLNLRGTPYLLTLDDIANRAREAWNMGATEVTLQGGIHPDFDGDYYLHVTQAVKDAVPEMHVHGFTALEITEGAKRNGEDLRTYLTRMKEAGLASLPGTAAEILDAEARAVLCPDKVNTEEWLECHEVAHEVGLHSNVTIMFGSIENPTHWARHIVRTRDLQKRTGGFTEFIPLPFVHMASPIYLQKRSRRGPTFRETVLMHAIGRIAYHGHIDNVQVSWVKIGVDGARQLLRAGCNDIGGTLMDENISRAAGANHGQKMTEDGFDALVSPLGRTLTQRTTGYRAVAR